MLILALTSQLVAALLTSLIAVRALKGLVDRLLESIPPAGATLARKWLAAALIVIGVSSGIQLAGLGAGAGMLPSEGLPGMERAPLAMAAIHALGAALGALRGLAFAALFLFGLGMLSGAFGPAQERPVALGRGGEAGRRWEPRREAVRAREMPRGPRPGRGEESPSSGGEPRRLPGGGGRGRGPAPDRDRERREGRESFRDGRESFREGSSLAHGRSTAHPSSGPGSRHGARPIPDPIPGSTAAEAAGRSSSALRGTGERFPRSGPPRGSEPLGALRTGRGAANGERRGLGNDPERGDRGRMGAGDRPLENEPGM